MTSPRLILRNLLRRRGRFCFTLFGIAIGIASVVTFLALGGSLKAEIRREAAALGANLIVTPKGSCGYEQVSILTGEQLPTTITAAEVQAIRSIVGITALPFLTERSAVENRPIAIAGILPQETLHFKQWTIGAGRYFADEGEAGVVVGAVLAEQFKLHPGKSITLRGRSLPIVGALAPTGSKDDLTAFLPLAVAQETFNKGEHVSFVAVRVPDPAQVDQYSERIREKVSLGVVTDEQMLKSVLSIVGTVNTTLQLIAAVAVLAAAFGIVNTMLTATYERRREIGILQALGASRRTIFTLFLWESGLYGLFGGALGVALGALSALVAAPRLGSNAFTAFVKGSGGGGIAPLTVLSCIGLSVLVAICAGLYPAWQASRLSPVEAINHD